MCIRDRPHTVSIEYKQAKVLYGVCVDGTWALTDTKYKVIELLDFCLLYTSL